MATCPLEPIGSRTWRRCGRPSTPARTRAWPTMTPGSRRLRRRLAHPWRHAGYGRTPPPARSTRPPARRSVPRRTRPAASGSRPSRSSAPGTILVYPGVLAYDKRAQPASLHRLYQVEGVWHMSGDDDGTPSFMYIATKMGLDPGVAKAMREGPVLHTDGAPGLRSAGALGGEQPARSAESNRQPWRAPSWFLLTRMQRDSGSAG